VSAYPEADEALCRHAKQALRMPELWHAQAYYPLESAERRAVLATINRIQDEILSLVMQLTGKEVEILC
jgi:hypothetical protein